VNLSSITDYSKQFIKVLEEQAATLDGEYILCVIRELTLAQMRLHRTANSRVLLESTIIKICNRWFTYDNDEIFARLSLLESGMKTGQVISKPESAKPVETKVSEQKLKPETKMSEPEAKLPEPKPEVDKEISKPKPKTDSKPFKAKDSNLPKFEQWDKVRADLSDYGKKLLNTVTSAATAFQIDDSNILVVFPDNKNFEKKYFDKAENIYYISEAILRVCGKEMHCKFMMEEDAGDILGKNKSKSESEIPSADTGEKKDLFEDLKKNDIPFEIIED
jgi:DNA polymerase III gamma/tau subunit